VVELTIRLPEGSRAVALPREVRAEEGDARVLQECGAEGREVRIRRVVTIPGPAIDAATFRAVRGALALLGADGCRTILAGPGR
jgi:hypothetical protein